MRWSAIIGKPGLFGAPFHFGVDVRRDDLIERLPSVSIAFASAAIITIGSLASSMSTSSTSVFDSANALLMVALERIPLRRQHVQRSEQIGRRSALAFDLPQEVLAGLAEQRRRDEQQADDRRNEAMTHDFRLAWPQTLEAQNRG